MVRHESHPFLSVPIQAQNAERKLVTPFTARISAVIDHAGTLLDRAITDPHRWGLSAKDDMVIAFNGEVGDAEKCAVAPYGYAAEAPAKFFAKGEINYVGCHADGDQYPPEWYLQYDGHSGYDFAYPAGTSILAAADGTLRKAAIDPINGTNGAASAWDGFHSLYIEHAGGWETWYLHAETLAPDIEAALQAAGSVSVTRGHIIAHVGSYGTAGPHLHFEVRKNGNIVDPYAERLWEK